MSAVFDPQPVREAEFKTGSYLTEKPAPFNNMISLGFKTTEPGSILLQTTQGVSIPPLCQFTVLRVSVLPPNYLHQPSVKSRYTTPISVYSTKFQYTICRIGR